VPSKKQAVQAVKILHAAVEADEELMAEASA
jgi:hypothetical protein